MKAYVLIAVTVVLTLNGCMMAGMHDHDASHFDHATITSKTVESQNQYLKVVLIMPMPSAEDESEFAVVVTDKNSDAPISGAKVTFMFGPIHNQSTHQITEAQEIDASEAAEKGRYFLKHRLEGHDPIPLSVKVAKDESTEPIMITTSVMMDHSKSSSHSEKSIFPMIIVGTAVMVVMMVFMIGRTTY